MKIIVIGAGPIGSYIASKKGCEVIEERKNIGFPVQCTGLVSMNVDAFFKPSKKVVLNKVKGARITAPNGDCTVLKAKEDKAYVLDRQAYDQEIYEKALNKSEFRLGERYEKYERKGKQVIVHTNKKKYVADLLIGADGPNSLVARQLGLIKSSVYGFQVRAKLDKSQDVVELYFGNKVCPGFFAWTVPEGDGTSRIGLATKKPGQFMKKFLKELGVKKIIDSQAGVIPMGHYTNFVSEKVVLVGDAAGQVKATTGGGIVTGFHSAEILLQSMNKKNLEKSYVKTWKKSVGKELRTHWWMRKWFNSLNDKQLNQLLKVFKQAQLPLEMKGDMDYPSKYVLSLLTNPKVVFELLKTMVFK